MSLRINVFINAEQTLGGGVLAYVPINAGAFVRSFMVLK